MRIQRTIPPAAAPIYLRDFLNGIKGIFRGNREIERFRSELKEHFGVKHCSLVSSGKAALTIMLRALHSLHPERDEVLIPAFTCYSVPSAIVRAGLKVRLCDTNPDTLDFDYDQLSKILSSHQLTAVSNELSAENSSEPPAMGSELACGSKLLAIIPTHLFGMAADVERVKELACDPDIYIIEDAAQAMGNEHSGTKLGTLGDVGFFSLGRGKALSTIEGGIILTDQDRLGVLIARYCRNLAKYRLIECARIIVDSLSLVIFLNPHLFWFPKSLPFLRLGETVYNPQFRMREFSSFQAGLARRWVKKLHRFRRSRLNNAKSWQGAIDSKAMNSDELSAISYEHGLSLIRYPIRIRSNRLRRAILEENNRSGLGIMPTYPDTVSGIAELRGRFEGERFPLGEKLVREKSRKRA